MNGNGHAVVLIENGSGNFYTDQNGSQWESKTHSFMVHEVLFAITAQSWKRFQSGLKDPKSLVGL